MYFVVVKEHLYLILPIILDLIFQFALTEERIEGEKKVVLQEIASHQNAPDAMWDLFALYYWETNPLRHPIRGYIESVRNLSCSHLHEHYQQFIRNENMVISCAGEYPGEGTDQFFGNLFQG